MNKKDYTIYIKTKTYETVIHLINEFNFCIFQSVREEECLKEMNMLAFNSIGSAIEWLIENEEVVSFEIIK